MSKGKCERFVFRDLLNTLPPLETVEEQAPIREAVGKMCSKNYSQLPVIKNEVCLSTVTSDSILSQIERADQKGYCINMNWPVRRFLDKNPPRFVSPDDDLLKHVDWMASKSFVLVGSPKKLEAIVTNYDLILFFKQKTQAFLLLCEIENAIRFLINQTLSKQELKDGIALIKQEDKTAISSLADLTLDNLRQLILALWSKFKDLLKNKEQTDKQLQTIRNIRNEIFHFRKFIDEPRLQDLQRLRDNYIRLAVQTSEDC